MACEQETPKDIVICIAYFFGLICVASFGITGIVFGVKYIDGFYLEAEFVFLSSILLLQILSYISLHATKDEDKLSLKEHLCVFLFFILISLFSSSLLWALNTLEKTFTNINLIVIVGTFTLIPILFYEYKLIMYYNRR